MLNKLEVAYAKIQTLQNDLNNTNQAMKNYFTELEVAYEQVYATNEELRALNEQLTKTVAELEHTKKENERYNLRLEQALRSAHMGAWEVETATGYNTWTSEIYKIYEVPDSYDVNVENSLALYTEDSQKILAAAIDQAIDQATPFDLTLEFVSAKNNPKWVRITCVPLIEDKKVTKLYGTFEDITQSKKEQLTLEKLSLVASRITNGVIISNPQGKVEWCNVGFERLSGYILEELHGKKLGPILQGKDTNKAIKEQIRIAIHQKKPVSTQILNYHKNGTPYWIQIDITPVFNKDGLLDYFAGIQTNIDALKKQEEELYFHSTILSNVKDSVIVTDLEGNITYFNQGASAIFGYTPAEVLGKSPQLFYSDYLVADFLQNILLSQNEGDYKDIWKGYNSNCIAIWLDLTFTVLRNSRGEVNGMMLIGKDISDRYQAELMLEETAKLAKIGGWELDLATNITTLTKEASKIYNLPVGKKLTPELGIALHAPEYQEKLWQMYMLCREEGKPFEMETQVITSEGISKWVYLQGFQVKYTDSIVKLKGTIQDITERKTAQQQHEKQLLAIDNRLMLATESMNIGIWEWNSQNDRLIWDSKMFEIYEVNPIDFKGRIEDFRCLVHPDDLAFIDSTMQKSMAGNQNPSIIFRILTDSGKTKYIKSNVIVIKDTLTNNLKLIGTNWDITEDVLQEQELKTSKHFIDNVADTSPHILYVYDVVLKQYIYINHQLKSILGYTLTELNELEDGIHTLVHPEDLPKVYASEIKMGRASNTEILKTEFRMRHQNNHWLWMAEFLKVFQRDTDGAIWQITGVLEDITMEKEAEIKLLKSLTELRNFQRALNASALIMLTDMEGAILNVNKTFCKASQYTPKELIGKNPNILKSGHQDMAFYKDLWDTIRQGKYWHGEICNKAKDETLYWVDVTVCPIRDMEGDIIQFLSVQYLITERKTMEVYKDTLLNDLGAFAFITSHNLRRPLANILGLVSIFNYENVEDPLNFTVLASLKKSAEELDIVIHSMNELLERNSLIDITKP